jgi:hypothetical protein
VSSINTSLSTTMTNTTQLKSGLGIINSSVNTLGSNQVTFYNDVKPKVGGYTFTTIGGGSLFI